jgi:DNA-binding beta-propeller fold protein YncE
MKLLLSLVLFSTYTQGTTFLVPPFKHTLGFYRASKFYIDLYIGEDFQMSNPQGITGAKMDEENDLSTSADDHILTLFAVNSGTGQIIYNTKLTNLKVFGKSGYGPGEFRSPYGIATNPKGEVYVADAGNNRIVKLKYTQGTLSFDRIIAESLGAPRGVALDSKKNLYVTDTKNSRIIVYDSSGTISLSWTKDLNQPTAIAVIDKDDEYNYYKEDYLIVIDNENKRIQKFNLTGQLQSGIDSRMIGLSSAEFAYFAIDYHANIYVTDMINNQIHKFDRFLNYIISIGRQGTGEVEFISPRGVFIWKRFGQVFVTEVAGGQYYWLGTDGYFIGCFPSKLNETQQGTTIALYLTELSEMKVEIYDSTNILVRSLIPQYYQPPGEALIAWDGRDNNGKFLTVGEYTIRAYLYPTYSAPRRYFKKELDLKITKL